MKFNCSICGIVCLSFRRLCSHLGTNHSGQPYRISCGINGCLQTFTSSAAYRMHGYRKHRDFINQSVTGPCPDVVLAEAGIVLEDEAPNCSEVHGTVEFEFDFHATESESFENDPIAQPFARKGDLAYLHQKTTDGITNAFIKAQEQYLLPKSSARGIFAEVAVIFQGFCHELIEHFTLTSMQEEILGDQYFESMFANVSSDWRVTKYIENNKNYVAPVSHRIPALRDDSDADNSSPSYMHSIPLRQTLICLTSNESLLAEILRYTSLQPHTNLLRDFVDGSAYTRTYNTLDLIFYTDELEVCNPIGSSRIKHKVCAVYFTLACLPPSMRSQTRHIFLYSLIPDKLRKKYGYTKILQPLVDELNDLAVNPIIIENGSEFVVRLLAFCGDNLSAHGLGGFQGSFSSGYICRFCHCHYSELTTVFLEGQCHIRNADTIHENLGVIDSVDSNSYGIKSRSILLKLQTRSAVDLTRILLPDVFHDFIEGVAPHVISIVLSHLKDSGLITLTNINKLIQAFQYKLNNSHLNPYIMEITTVNLKERRIKGTGSQKWCLLVHLPLILGTELNIDSANTAWGLLIKCREIGEIILADCIPRENIGYLANLIATQNKLINELGTGKITPKCHFLIHYPRLIEMFGPPRRFWTMRFESKHQYFKDISRKLKNFKNLTKTLATRCQTLQAVWLSSESFIPSLDRICGPGEKKALSDFSDDMCNALKDAANVGYFEDEPVFDANWVKANGFKYSKSCVLISGMVHEDIPLFYKVEYIVNIRSKWYLGGRDLVPERFDSKTWSYLCKLESSFFFQELSNLYSRAPALCYKIHGVTHVLLYALPSKI